jgi:hypothetical protein
VDCTSADITAVGSKRITALSGTCDFAAGAVLTTAVSTQCGTAQPTVYNIDYRGRYQ